jgi:hypothetical protein
VVHDGLGRMGAGEAPAGRRAAEPLERLRPERSGIGIEPEYDATAALLDERREPVAEMQSRSPGQDRDLAPKCEPRKDAGSGQG